MTNIITPRQTGFINTLLSEREVPTPLLDAAKRVATSVEASHLINALMVLPRRAAARPAVSPEYREYLEALAAVEVSKYAVPTRYLVAFPGFARMQGDLLFFEVRNYGGKRYLNRLVGAPGAFSRYRVGRADALGLLRLIKGRHIEFAGLFAEHYKCCGRCAAPLTDQTSRETGFGPECRKAFGL